MIESLLGLSLTLQLLSAKVALAQVEPPVSTPQTPLERTKSFNAFYAAKYGNDVGVMEEVLRCESNFKQTAVGDHGNARGVAQFWKGTFDRFKAESGLDVEYTDEEGQIELMNWAMAHGYESHWSCHAKVLKK